MKIASAWPTRPAECCLAYNHEDFYPYVIPLSIPFSFLFSFVNGKPFKININDITVNIFIVIKWEEAVFGNEDGIPGVRRYRVNNSSWEDN